MSKALFCNVVPRAAMTFLLFLLVIATLFLRPAELLPDLAALPIYEALIGATVLGAHKELQAQLMPSSLVRQPLTVCVLGLAVAIGLSHLTHVYLAALWEGMSEFAKTALFYLLVVGLVNTPDRFRKLLLTVAISASVMIGLCVADYVGLVDFQFVTHVSDRDDELTATGEEVRVLRMRGTGIFEDPNDLSMVIVLASGLCLYFLCRPPIGPARLMWLVPLAVNMTGLLCTRSRGGLLACGAALTVLALFRYGKWAAAGMIAAGVVVLSVLGGRQGNIDLEDGTAQDRIQLWREGLVALISPDLLFGVGWGGYADLAGLQAHNSFVHAYVELGIFGGTLFFGCFFFAGLAVWRLARISEWVGEPEIQRFLPFLAAALVGWGTGLLSLSRCYVVPTYLVFGLATAYCNLAAWSVVPPRLLTKWDRAHLMPLAGTSGAVLAGFFVFVKVFARFTL